MATIEKRTSRSGMSTWRVKWRTGGRRDGVWDGETCDDFTTARSFRALVEAAGEQRPPGYPRGCRGKKTQTIVDVHGVLGAHAGRLLNGASVETTAAQATVTLLQSLLGEADTNPKAGSQGVSGLGSEAVAVQRTFEDVFVEYLGRLRRLGKVEPRQLTDYRRTWERHVARVVVEVPGRGEVGPLDVLPVREITGEVVEAWVAWMGERRWTYSPRDKTPKPYSPKTIANIHGTVVSPVLGFAAKRGYIDANPAAGLELPERRGHTVTLDCVPTGNEPETWIAIGYEVSALAGGVIAIAFGTGLRWARSPRCVPAMSTLRPGC